MRKKLIKIFVFAILLLGIFIRLWRIDKASVSLFGDEIDVGLQAQSILETGNDYLGTHLPTFFHSFSEYRLPIQLYMDVPFIKVFGLNEIGVRAPAVLMGFLSLFFFYLLVGEISGKKIATVATIFLFFSPWHLNFSRQANDAGILLPFILSGTWAFLKGLKEYKYLLLSTVLFALSIYSYAIATLFTPIFVFTLLLIYRKKVLKIKWVHLLTAFLVGLIILVPYLNGIVKGTASSRFNYISVINKDDLTSEVISQRKWSNSLASKIFYNRYTVAFERLGNNYLRAYSTEFLFVKGDANGRQSVSGFGMLYHFDLILIIVGAFLVIKRLLANRKGQGILLLISWLLLAPLPSVLTKDGGNHASRLILMMPPLILLSAVGFEFLLRKKKKLGEKVIICAFIILMVFDISKFIHRYFVIWPGESWRIWQYGFKEVLTDVAKQDDNYTRIYFNNTYEPILPRFLFYYGYDMKLFQKQFTKDVHIEGILPGFNGFSLGDKYYFGELIKPIEPLAKKGHLVVASAQHDVTDPSIFGRSDLKLIETYYSPTAIPIFYTFTAN